MTEGERTELFERLRRAYPDGSMENFEDARGLSIDTLRTVVSFLKDARSEACLHAQLLWDMPCSYEVAYTLEETIPFAQWLNWNDQGKLSFLAVNEKLEDGFGVLLVRLSKVVPYYSFNFNVWREVGSSGQVICECQQETLLSARWKKALQLIQGGAHKAGFLHLDFETAGLVHPSITEVDFENSSLGDEFFFDNPPRKPASLRNLIFGE